MNEFKRFQIMVLVKRLFKVGIQSTQIFELFMLFHVSDGVPTYPPSPFIKYNAHVQVITNNKYYSQGHIGVNQ